jgi:hypothetical protein
MTGFFFVYTSPNPGRAMNFHTERPAYCKEIEDAMRMYTHE